MLVIHPAIVSIEDFVCFSLSIPLAALLGNRLAIDIEMLPP